MAVTEVRIVHRKMADLRCEVAHDDDEAATVLGYDGATGLLTVAVSRTLK